MIDENNINDPMVMSIINGCQKHSDGFFKIFEWFEPYVVLNISDHHVAFKPNAEWIDALGLKKKLESWHNLGYDADAIVGVKWSPFGSSYLDLDYIIVKW